MIHLRIRNKNININKNKKSYLGFTLIEVMVALVIGSIVMYAMTKILFQSKEIFRVQNNLEKIQDDSRFVFETISQEVRGSGFRGCISGANVGNFWLNYKDATPAANYQTSMTPIQGYYGNGSFSPSLDSSISQPASNPTPNPNFDVLTVRNTSNSPAVLSTSMLNVTDSLNVNSVSGLSVGSYAIISNCAASTLFQVNSFSGNNITPNGTGLSFLYPTNSQIYSYSTINYYVANVGTDNILYRTVNGGTAEALIGGVEGFSILYGLDTFGDFNATKYVYANNVTNPTQIVSIRIGLVLKSAENNISVSSAAANNYIFKGNTIVPGDKRLRKVFYTTINLRDTVS